MKIVNGLSMNDILLKSLKENVVIKCVFVPTIWKSLLFLKKVVMKRHVQPITWHRYLNEFLEIVARCYCT